MSGLIGLGGQAVNLGSTVYSMFFADNKKSEIGVIALDVLVSENLKLPSDVTKYPVETGGEEISDHITQGNEELSITGSIASSSSELFAFSFAPCTSKFIDAISKLRSMHKDRQPITVITGLGKYENMAFTSLSIIRSNSGKDGGWLTINADLRHIKKVSLKQADMPDEQKASSDTKGKTGKSEKSTGQSGNADKPPEQGENPFRKIAREHLGYKPPATPLIGSGGIINP